MRAYIVESPVHDAKGERIATARFVTADGEKAKRVASEGRGDRTWREVDSSELKPHERENLERAAREAAEAAPAAS